MTREIAVMLTPKQARFVRACMTDYRGVTVDRSIARDAGLVIDRIDTALARLTRRADGHDPA